MKEDWLNQNHIRNLDMMMMLNGWFLLHFQKRFNRCGLDGMPRKKVIRSQRQEIFYLPQINQSPTSTAFFAETLKRALKFADHFKKESVAVTYDLAITKTAMQMQATETPTYDKVFVALGAFHLSCLSSVLQKSILLNRLVFIFSTRQKLRSLQKISSVFGTSICNFTIQNHF